MRWCLSSTAVPGGVAGIIGAGGNVGAVAAGFLMKGTGDIRQTLIILSALVVISALCAIAVRFTREAAEPNMAAA